jgi:hypothetical protein
MCRSRVRRRKSDGKDGLLLRTSYRGGQPGAGLGMASAASFLLADALPYHVPDVVLRIVATDEPRYQNRRTWSGQYALTAPTSGHVAAAGPHLAPACLSSASDGRHARGCIPCRAGLS